MEPIFYLTRRIGDRIDKYLMGDGSFTQFERTSFGVFDITGASERLAKLQADHDDCRWPWPVDYAIRRCDDWFGCEPGSNVLDSRSADWARRIHFTAAHADIALRADRWNLPQLKRQGVIVIGRFGHYAGNLSHPIVDTTGKVAPATQGNLFEEAV